MQRPGGQRTTKSLNTGVTGTITAATILGVNFYATLAGQLYPFYLLNSTPITTTGFFAFANVFNTSPTAPPTNTAGIQSPSVAPVVQVGPSSSGPPAGTYMIGYTFVTHLGETALSPLSSLTLDGAHDLEVQNGTAGGTKANSGFVTVELVVPNLEDWHVTRYAIYCPSVNSVPTCNLYIDTQAITSLLDTTTLGAQNSANADIYLRPGQRMIAQWLQADTGTQATLSVYGEKTS